MIAFLAAAAVSAWTFSVNADPITDTKIAVIQAFDTKKKVIISLRCENPGSGHITLFATSSEYLGGKGGRQNARNIIYRVDEQIPSMMTGIYRGNDVAVLGYEDMASFLRSAETVKSRIALRFETYSGEYVDAIIPASGAIQNFRKIMEFCQAR